MHPLNRPDRSDWPELPPTPPGFKVWFAFCAIVGVGFLGVVVWAIVEIVGKVTR